MCVSSHIWSGRTQVPRPSGPAALRPCGLRPGFEGRSRESHPLNSLRRVATELPTVSPYLLDRGPTMCRRRLAAVLGGRQPSYRAFTRWRVRDPLVAGAEDAQVALGLPDVSAFVAPPHLVAEERAVFQQAARGYVALFSDSPAQVALDHGCHLPTPDRRRQVRLGGAVDLVLRRSDGQVELRQLELWGRPVCADPDRSWAVLVAALRLAPWTARRPLLVVHADPLQGRDQRHLVEASEHDQLADHLDDRLALLRRRSADPVPEPGTDCGSCDFIADCPALRR